MRTLMQRAERITEKQMTTVVKQRFGADFYALKRRGYRRIVRRVSDMCVDIYGSASTFIEAVAQADKRIAAEKSSK